jgi:hypothetical protein
MYTLVFVWQWRIVYIYISSTNKDISKVLGSIFTIWPIRRVIEARMIQFLARSACVAPVTQASVTYKLNAAGRLAATFLQCDCEMIKRKLAVACMRS